MIFEEREIDYRKTKRKVDRAINQYYKSLTRVKSNYQPKITQSFSLSMPSFSGGFHSKTEDAALTFLDDSNQDVLFVGQMVSVINSLNEENRQIIIESYFKGVPNDILADKLGVSIATLIVKKRQAIEFFAYGLGICEYLETN